ncbi:hypothetical protein MIND_01203000 [Mycena indigotica]|uniref:Uncharacterized protein n=1 Tax=Mycena indigotica TaxID=2126181 RepID=A0A8H6S6L4_9AGAR|nr:uncharacterized protein MIND_01203000 [Mycena indigotica]KAF7293036.1 hypothetical protein MIND_01203000 [Mycena indigotica]
MLPSTLLYPFALLLACTVALAQESSTTTPISSTTTSTTTSATSTPTTDDTTPDVHLRVPQLHVGRIELDVDNLQANLNLKAKVASLVQVNAGVAVSIEKVNITISQVDAEVELVVRLGHLVDIVNRVFKSLDLNPLLIDVINDVTDVLRVVVGAVDGLIGSITQNGNVLNFLIDNLGNIVQEVTDAAGAVTSTIVGDFKQNMTATGAVKQLADGLIEKTFSFAPLNALVDIVFNEAGQVVQATVQKKGGSGTTTTTTTTSPTPAPTRAKRHGRAVHQEL